MRAMAEPLVALILALTVGGCKQPSAATPAVSPATVAAPAAPTQPADEAAGGARPVAVKAYINISSGCQQETVDLLKRLAAANSRLSVEFIDFGSGAGNRRWQQDGLNCMAILINGKSTVTFGDPGHRRIVTFQFPPGYGWIASDLERAIRDALAGKLYYGEEPGASRIESQTPQLRVTSREATLNGKKIGEVVVNGQVAIRLRTSYDGLPPLQRADQAASRLRRLLGGDFTPQQLRVTQINGRTVLAGNDKVICVADPEQARLLGTTPSVLAQSWATALRKALTAAMAKG